MRMVLDAYAWPKPAYGLLVRGPFSVAWPHVLRWSSDLARLGFCLGSCVRNSTLGHVVQQLPAYF